MFTVKVIDEEGNESVLDAHSVQAKASKRNTSNEPYAIEAVSFQTSDGAEIEIAGSGPTIYVMNANGKTVSKYILGLNNGQTSYGVSG
jgi:hypothetical protein